MHFPFQTQKKLFHHILSYTHTESDNHWKLPQIPNCWVLRGFPRLHDDLHRLPCRHRGGRGTSVVGTLGTAAAFGGRSAPDVFGAPNLTTFVGDYTWLYTIQFRVNLWGWFVWLVWFRLIDWLIGLIFVDWFVVGILNYTIFLLPCNLKGSDGDDLPNFALFLGAKQT